MKFGASTFIWVSPFSGKTYDLFDKVKDFGFDLLEICIEDPSTINTYEIKELSKKKAVDVLVCGAFGPERDVSSEDAGIRESGLNYINKCIDFAAELGSPLVSGPMFSATGKTHLLSKSERQQQWQWAVENLTKSAEYAGEKGVKLAIEPLNRFETDFINTTEQGLELVEKINHHNVGLLLDTFHMNIEEKDIANALRLAGDRLFNFHACSNDRGIPGVDNIPWESVSKALKDINYDGPVVIESFTTEIKEISRAVSQWRTLAPSQDSIAQEGLPFLKKVLMS
ncbi:sugar phosphate isomerase/epimerase family protein [Metabacillus idriensis]|uniref:sugar phosphate isomerase/epimerase family protein n=1 Tax=Metabacillus idriensis TaxID=324768 RepID=UPI00174B6879|nr:sugar phosphate isomerase/epimerase family protein [Metabacillus idriensis]